MAVILMFSLGCSTLAGAAAPDKSGVKPQVLSLPSGPGSIEGLGGSFEPLLNSGTSAYRVPLAVPPGRNGLEPQLALQYDSGAGNGHFGVGWKLPLDFIHRQFDKGTPRYSDRDVFVYSNGEEIVPLGDGSWRCENEADFMRFFRVGDGWEVTARNGTVYRLGQTPASRVQNPAAGAGTPFDRTFKWYVDSIEDANGNRIELFYDSESRSPGELYLREIRYNRSGSDYNAVLFDYEERDDAFNDYRAGFLIRTARRGTTIRMESRRALVREYRLAYEDSAAEVMAPAPQGAGTAVPLRVSLLSKVTQFDRRGTSYLPPLRLGYTQLVVPSTPQLAVIQNAPLNLSQRLVDGSADLLDVNADGLPDVLDTTESVHLYYPNLGRSRFGPAAIVGVDGNAFRISGASLGNDGAALADMDGDGMSDLLRAPGDTVFRNRGDGTWAPGAVFENFPFIDINGPDVRLIDVNFDKATDVIRSDSGQHWVVCENPNRLDVDYPPYGNFPAAEDIDKNHLPGTLLAGAWSCRTVDMPFPDGIVFANPRVQLADMNGDRIQDVVEVQVVSASERSLRYWPGKGNLEFDDPIVLQTGQGGPVLDIGAGIADANLKLNDVNADGLTDLLAIGSGFLRFWINLGGDQWSERVGYNDLPGLDDGVALRFADMNGNGTTDVVWIRYTGSSAPGWLYLDFAPQVRPNQLSLIDNGLGRRIEIQYASSIDFMVAARDDAEPSNPWMLRAPFPLQVVSRVITRPTLELDGKDGDDQYITDFVYRDAYYDGYEHEFRGFAFVKKIERGDDTAPTQVSRIWFHTGAPDQIDNDGDGQLDERTEKGGVEEESLKGRVLRQEITTAEGGADHYGNDGQIAFTATLFSSAANQWAIRQLHGPAGGSRDLRTLDERNVSFAFNRQSDTELIEQGRGDPKTIRTLSEYDDFGNVTLQSELGEIGRDGDERHKLTEFAFNLEKWIIDKPISRTISSVPLSRTSAGEGGGEGPFLTRSRFYYDGTDYFGLPLGEVQKGNLTREEGFVADGEYVDKSRKRYDAHGNVIGIMDANGEPSQGGVAGHLDEIEYDDVFQTFPVRETIHVGGGKQPLVMTAEYHLGLGVMTASVDFNGNRSSYLYDSFGRLTGIVKPYDSEALPTQEFSYHMSDPARGVVFDYDRDGNQAVRHALSPSFVQTGKRERHGEAGTFDVRQYVDGIGRKLGTVEEGETAFILKEAVRFNARGSVRDTYQPFETSSSDYNLGFANYFTTMIYDATGREVQKINPPETTDCSNNQQPSNLTTAPACRTSVTTVHRPLEKSVFDENGNEMAYLTDGLKPLDDNGERLIEVQEVNQGERYRTFYEYNPVDSLTRIEDAQNNVKLFAYDGLQRKTFMNDPDRGVMSYNYDAASNLVETIDAKGQRIVYAYDGVNRLLSEDYKDEGLSFSAERVPDVEYHYDDPYGPVDPGDVTPPRTAQNTRGFLSWVRDLSGEEHNSYDARGRVQYVIKRICDPKLQTSRYCDAQADSNIVWNYKTEMTYDALDRVVDLIYPDNDQVTYEYNNRTLPERILGGPSGCILCNVDYQPSGQQARIDYGNGVQTNYAYDPRLRLIDLHTRNPMPPSPEAAELIHYKYTFDPASNITRIDDARPVSAAPAGDPRRNTQIFGYDDLYRLTRVQYSFNLPGEADRNDGYINYSYDRIGNMLSQVSNIDHEERGRSVTNHGTMLYGGSGDPNGGRSGRIGRSCSAPGCTTPPGPHALTATHSGANPFNYDANGNMTTLDGMTLEWDFKDRLIAVENTEMRAEYAYDYTDRRVVKEVSPRPPSSQNPPTAAVYVDKYFEVREYDQPVKYGWIADIRFSRSSAHFNPEAAKIQRLRVSPGWNLVALLVRITSSVQFQVNPAVHKVFVWDDTTASFRAAEDGEDIPDGSIVWIYAWGEATLVVRGESQLSKPPHLSAEFLRAGSFEPLSLDRSLADSSTAWTYDPASQLWRGWANFQPPLGSLEDLSDAADALAVSEVAVVPDTTAVLANLTAPAVVDYLHADHLSSVELATNSTAEQLYRRSYLPFGARRTVAAPARFSSDHYLFIQKETDRETSLQYFEARMLSGAHGRFLSTDPAGLTMGPNSSPQRLNAYAYAVNQPLTRVDRDGRKDEKAETGGWGIVATGLVMVGLTVGAIATAPVTIPASVLGGAAAVVGGVGAVGAIGLGVALTAGGGVFAANSSQMNPQQRSAWNKAFEKTSTAVVLTTDAKAAAAKGVGVLAEFATNDQGVGQMTEAAISGVFAFSNLGALGGEANPERIVSAIAATKDLTEAGIGFAKGGASLGKSNSVEQPRIVPFAGNEAPSKALSGPYPVHK